MTTARFCRESRGSADYSGRLAQGPAESVDDADDCSVDEAADVDIELDSRRESGVTCARRAEGATGARARRRSRPSYVRRQTSVVNLDSVESVALGTLVVRLGRLNDARMREVCAALEVAVACES
jgi:hypothetical protein